MNSFPPDLKWNELAYFVQVLMVQYELPLQGYVNTEAVPHFPSLMHYATPLIKQNKLHSLHILFKHK